NVAARLPTPDQSTITSGTSETYWTGALSNWGIDCVKKGYHVETLPAGDSMTYGNATHATDLSHYNVFIVDEPNIRFTNAEKLALLHFVQNGGGLFMIADHDMSDRNFDGWDSPNIWNDFMTNNGSVNNPFGIAFDLDNFSETSTNIASNTDSLITGSMGTATGLKYSGGTSMTLNPTANATVKGIIYKTGSSFGNNNVMLARARYGLGKVAAIGDSSPCDDGTGSPIHTLYSSYSTDLSGSHQKLLMNTTIWLATSVVTAVSDITVSTNEIRIFPNPASEQTVVSYTIPLSADVALRLFDMSGRMIQTIEKKNQFAGRHSETLNCSSLQKGVYLVEIKTGSVISTKKIIIQ
ncbi:MAG: T9SS type A sorting domain-containing protein, partial [Bacteroidota bacterium]